MTTFKLWFSRTTEFIAASMLAAIFCIFLIQIFSRYASKIAWIMPIPALSSWLAQVEPVGWTVNLISFLWVWAVFFGCSFIVGDRDQVSFDIIYLGVSKSTRKVLAILTAVIMVAAILYSFMPTYESLFANRLMELKKIQTLAMPFTGEKIPMKWLFASLLMLMGVLLVRYTLGIINIIRFGAPDVELDDFSSADNSDINTPDGGVKP